MDDASISNKTVALLPDGDIVEATEDVTSVPEKLDAEVLAAIDEGIRISANGRVWTLDEALTIARSSRESALASEQIGIQRAASPLNHVLRERTCRFGEHRNLHGEDVGRSSS